MHSKLFVVIMDNWYALFAPNNTEEKIKRQIDTNFNDEINSFIYKRLLNERRNGKYEKVERKLFPGYIILKGNIDKELYSRMREVIKPLNILRNGEEILTIKDDELRIIERLTNNSRDLIEISSIYKENDKIKVLDGPLVGLEGRITSLNPRKGRAKVKLNFIGEERIVELGIEIVDKIQTK